MLRIRRIQNCQDVSYSQCDTQIQGNPNQNPSKLFYGYQQTYFIWRGKRPSTANTMLKKHKVRTATIDFKTYYSYSNYDSMVLAKEHTNRSMELSRAPTNTVN